jgi:hypothetical protein
VGKIPDDLPDVGASSAAAPSLTALPAVEEETNSDIYLGGSRTGPTNNRDVLPAPPSPTIDSDLSHHDLTIMKSDIPALDHFPTPPVHFPLPHLRGALKSSLDGSTGDLPLYGRRITSASPTQEFQRSTATTPTEPAAVMPRQQPPSPTANTLIETSAYRSVPFRSDSHQNPSKSDSSADVLEADNEEFGVRQSYSLRPSDSVGSSSLPKGSPRNSGVVLAMRNRFPQNVSQDRCSDVIENLNFAVRVPGSVEKSYDFNPSSTGHCISYRQ